MDRALGKLLATLLLLYLIGFLVFLTEAYFQVAEANLVLSVQAEWIVNAAAARFLEGLLPLHCFGVALGFSLLIRRRDIGGNSVTGSLGDLVRSALVLFMVLTAAYTVGIGIFLPQFENRVATLEERSAFARSYLREGRQAHAEQDYGEAVQALERYLAIQPANAQAERMLRSAREQMDRRSQGAEEGASEAFQPAHEATDFTTGELLDRASRFFEREEFFSAHYYATLALEQSPELEAARRLVSRSRERISRMNLSKAEEEERRLYRRKREGYTALHGENENPIEAYYIFRELKQQYPDDPDVNRYYEQAVSKVNEVAFFVEEINRNIYRPAERRILFRNRRGNGITEFVYIGSLIRSPEGTYALDIEGIGLNSEWGVQYHFQAEYGKFRGQHLIMRALDRDDPAVRREPTYIEGNSLPGELSSVLRLSGPPEELETVSQGGAALERASVLTLWDMTQLFPQYGFPVEPVYMELGMRLMRPFAFLSLTIFVAALAWRWRSRYIARPPLFALALLPAVPFIFGYVTSLYVHAHQILIGFLLLFAGMAAAFAVLILVETLILVIALFALVGQTTGS